MICNLLSPRRLFFGLSAILAGASLFAQTPVRIVAANISSGNNQDYQAPGTNILKALEGDIVLIQEFTLPGTNNNAAIDTWVDSTFGTEYVWFREPGGENIPNGIISRYPILEAGEWPDSSVGDRDYVWARIDVPGSKDLWAISVHLKAGETTTQNSQVLEILDEMQTKGIPTTDFVVIGGDFNTTSRTGAPMNSLANSAWNFVTAGPYPVGEDGISGTNAGRNDPYDCVIPNPALNAIKTSTVYLPKINTALPSKLYTNGLVLDTRDFTQANLNQYFPPTQTTDSGVFGMQHMAVVRTYMLPENAAPPADGTVATVATTNRAAGTAAAGADAPMFSVTVSVASAEWDATTLSLQRLGTAPDAQITAKVYSDNDNNGAVSAGDELLGSSAFSGGNTIVALGTPAPRATSGQPIRLLAVAGISSGATAGATVQLRSVANGLASSVSGGNDPNPTYAAFTSDAVTVSGTPPPPPPANIPVVINKYFNHGTTAASDVIELLVVQDGIDMRGMIVKDFSSNMGVDNGGKFAFGTQAIWSNVRAGTIIILRNNNTAADTTVGGTDFTLDVGLTNATYFNVLGGSLDLAGVEMVTIKAAGSGMAGTNSAIHSLSGGTPGAVYTAAPAPKLNSTTGAGTGQYLFVTNSGPSGASRLTNFAETNGTAAVAAGALTFGVANNPANANFIALLRGTSTTPATAAGAGQFTANWAGLTAAAGYRLDVARDAAFTNLVAGYSQLVTGATTSQAVTGLAADTYYYRVRGVDADSTIGGVSSTTSVVVPTASGVDGWEAY